MICAACVKLDSLKLFINQNSKAHVCEFCKTSQKCVDKEQLYSYMENQLFEVLTPTDYLSNFEQAMIYECGSDEPPVYTLFDFIQDADDVVAKEVAEEFINWLPAKYHKDERGSEALYVLDDGTLEYNDYAHEWEKFVKDIHHGRRFFNEKAKDFLDSLLTILDQGGKLYSDVVEVIDCDAQLYRARIVSGKTQIEEVSNDPASQLGPVPEKLASNQRMTPAGISAMYCSLDRNTCLCELRTIVGDTAISGEFRPIKPLKLLNLSSLTSVDFVVGDYLSVDWRKHTHATEFFKEMVYKLSRPLGRQDELGYLSTQVFFEYLRVKYHKEVDGVQFTSVQTDGKGINIALFPESSVIGKQDEVDQQGDTSPLGRLVPKLCYVDKSLVFHRIKAVKIDSHDENSSAPYVMDELSRKRLYPGTNI